MANFIINAPTLFDSLVGAAGNDTYDISGGKLTIDTDVRYCSNRTAATGPLGNVTISSTLGGEVHVDGRNVRLIPFTGGSGTVPAIGTVISRAGVSADLLGVWSALNAAPTAVGATMPASGFIKVKNKAGGNFSAGALTGIGANASGADVVGWIEIVGVEAGTMNIPRIGKFTATGEWFDLGVTNGVAGVTYQAPASLANTYYAGVWVETAPGSDVFELYPAIQDTTSGTISSHASRGKVCWFSSTGGVRFSIGTPAMGYLPVAGCRIRVPNIIFMNCTSASPSTNAVPNATLATRYDFNTTLAGSVELSKCNMAWCFDLSQPFSVSIVDSSINDRVAVQRCTTAPYLHGVIVGMTSTSNTYQPLSITACAAGGTVSDIAAIRKGIASAGSSICYFSNLSGEWVFENMITFMSDFRIAGSYAYHFNACENVKVNKPTSVSGRIHISACSDIEINDYTYIDRPYGNVDNSAGMSAITIDASSRRILIDGIDFAGITTFNPYNGVVSITSSSDIEVRGIGTSSAPLDLGTGTAAAALVTHNGYCNNLRVRRCWVKNTRTGLFISTPLDSGVEYQNIYGDYSDQQAVLSTNTVIRGCAMNPSYAAQSAVYGFHWMDVYTSTTTGAVVIACNEKTNVEPSASSYQITSGTPKFTSTGTVQMSSVGDQIVWEMPYFAIGHTGFSGEPTLYGTNTNNISMDYQIDVGSGFGSWKALTGANLATESFTPADGFKLRVRATVTVAGSNQLSFVSIPTSTTESAQNDNLHPLDTSTINLTVMDEFGAGLVGYEWNLYLDDTSSGILGTNRVAGEAVAPASYRSATIRYNGVPQDYILQVIKEGYEEYNSTVTIVAGTNTLVPRVSIERNI